MTYYLALREECGGDEIHTLQDKPTDNEIEEICQEWLKEGEWGDEGARPTASWWLYDSKDNEIDSGSIEVDIEPNHERLIEQAAYTDDICGTDPDDHDWTSEGEGGCDENPGVWSVGGTSMVFKSHCRKCGLHRTECSTGSQRNPGEHDTVEYRILDEDEIEHLIMIGAMREDER